MAKRIFDIVFSLLGLLVLAPVFAIVSIAILFSGGEVYYRQERIGLNSIPFVLIKFRTMVTNADQGLNITIGNNDQRITKLGRILRRFKIDELPQLVNVLRGEMSLVGPRPEVPRYVALYNEKQKKVLSVKPGITDYASIKYRHENELLAEATQGQSPEEFYIHTVMPHKLALNLLYVKKQSFILDIKLIVKTLVLIFVKT